MFLKELNINELKDKLIVYDGVEGKIINTFMHVNGRIIEVQWSNVSTPIQHLFDISKDVFEVVQDEQPITLRMSEVEKPCKNKTCGKMNYMTDKKCWHCEIPNPSDY